VAYNQHLYIVGGIEDSKAAVPPTCRIVNIYDPAKDTYETKPLVENPFITISGSELFNNRCVACKLND